MPRIRRRAQKEVITETKDEASVYDSDKGSPPASPDLPAKALTVGPTADVTPARNRRRTNESTPLPNPKAAPPEPPPLPPPAPPAVPPRGWRRWRDATPDRAAPHTALSAPEPAPKRKPEKGSGVRESIAAALQNRAKARIGEDGHQMATSLPPLPTCISVPYLLRVGRLFAASGVTSKALCPLLLVTLFDAPHPVLESI